MLTRSINLFFNVRLLLSYKKGAFPPEQFCAVPEAGRKYQSAGVCFGLASLTACRFLPCIFGHAYHSMFYGSATY